MSRLAKKSLPIPNGASVKIENGVVVFNGTLGSISQDFDQNLITPVVDDAGVLVKRNNDSKEARAKQGLYWVLFKNHLAGVSQGFEKQLEIQGVGYRWEVKGQNLHCLVGFSHPVIFEATQDVKLEQPSPNIIVVKGINKQIVGQVAANIRFIKKPEPYKGKGIRYVGEVVRLKEGKGSGKK
ncbi:MAG: 50S ribosomal protein L6 [Brevinemataceae bacterium]